MCRYLVREPLDRSENATYRVIINHEEQYSVWPAELDLPKGWKTTGMKGGLSKCQNYLEEVWTDMRPLSLRKREELKKN